MDIDFIIRFESGEVSKDEIIENFQKGINDGSVWKLQGFYGRTAKSLIDNEYCHWPKNQTCDYYNNSLPTSEKLKNYDTTIDKSRNSQ